MTVELDIVDRKNEENLKLTKQMEDTMKKLIMEQSEPIAPAINDAEYDRANWVAPTPATDIQRFYAGKNIFITGGTGESSGRVIEWSSVPAERAEDKKPRRSVSSCASMSA